MEKLLITLTHSDGYTYSSEETLPVIFSSKEEFIITLEDMVQKYIKDCEEFQVLAKKEQKKHDAVREAYSHVIDKKNRSKPNAKLTEQAEEATKKYLEANSEHNKFLSTNTPDEQFQLGGQTFNFENFTYRSEEDRRKIQMDIPRVCTIDEFFFEVDLKLTTNKFKP